VASRRRCTERDAMGWACTHKGSNERHLVTIETSRPGDPYTLFASGPTLNLHLAGPGEHGGTGPCLCGFDRHASGVGFSVGGGTDGPSTTHVVCRTCADLGRGAHITGTHARHFTEVVSRG
jgi:hypothetical protein